MTYNWNTMVEITVPTGTNGWLYSGEVIINGVKVRFPVGVPTSVPEPAAVLLKKMIEMEQEEEANTAKPQNHYVGDVTIPEGKTLTLQKGAKVEDPEGILGGGTPAPTEVVILPETVTTIEEGDSQAYIMTPLSATPTEGATAKVTYNGTEYTSPIGIVTDDGIELYAMGNTDVMGIPGGNPDAPFVVALIPDGMEGAYGMVMPLDGVTTVTLSIVQTEGGASGGDASGGVFTARVVASASTKEMTLSDCDKTFPEIVAAYNAGKVVRIVASADDNTTEYIGSIVHAIIVNGSPMMFLVSMPYGTCVDSLVHMLKSNDGTTATFTYHAGKPA